MKIRILCLHDENSSALSLIDQLQLLGQRLQHNHNIELAFVNAPHIVIPPKNKKKSCYDDDTDANPSNDEADNHTHDNDEEEDDKERVWYYNCKENIGLDASILHLRQIWTRSLYSNPFSGILGVGQGAAVAGLLHFLSYENYMVPQEDTNGDDGYDDKVVDDDNEEDAIRPMFENLKFCIFINGWDILEGLHSTDDDSEKMAQDKSENDNENENVTFSINNSIPSLHIIPTQDDNNNHDGMKLFGRYGGDGITSQAEKYAMDQSQHSSSSSSNNNNNKKIVNVVGKFIVAQKMKIMTHLKSSSIQQSIIISNAETPHPSNDNLDIADIVKEIETTRLELARVEQEALELIQQTISQNPPKALMAMIMPDSQRGGSIVGGWDGDRDAFRSEEFIQSGGAPCPKEFTLPSKVRKENRGEVTAMDR
mmetsp:Transcript_2866/g.5377  ORF Transcript_2866/g.5377 Transcript_2866/m.5377 type:complete len:424 (+) Transcript_2866:58-1329(+)